MGDTAMTVGKIKNNLKGNKVKNYQDSWVKFGCGPELTLTSPTFYFDYIKDMAASFEVLRCLLQNLEIQSTTVT